MRCTQVGTTGGHRIQQGVHRRDRRAGTGCRTDITGQGGECRLRRDGDGLACIGTDLDVAHIAIKHGRAVELSLIPDTPNFGQQLRCFCIQIGAVRGGVGTVG